MATTRLLQQESLPDHFPSQCIVETSYLAECQAILSNYCSHLQEDNETYQLTDSLADNAFLDLLCLASGLIGLVFFLFIHCNREMQVHPVRLVMCVMMSESLLAFHLVLSHYVCEPFEFQVRTFSWLFHWQSYDSLSYD